MQSKQNQLQSTQEDLFFKQNNPRFIQTVLENLGPSLKKIIAVCVSINEENIFHKLASKVHLQSCEFLVNNLEDDFVAELMLSRPSGLKGFSPLVLAMLSSEPEVVELFWNACEKGVLNHAMDNPPCLRFLKVMLTMFHYLPNNPAQLHDFFTPEGDN